MDNDKIEIQLDEHTKLVAWKDTVSNLNEISVYIEKDGYIHQDLALIRQKFKYTEDDDVENIPGKYEALVWSNASQEDYTHKFEIDEYIDLDSQ